MQIHDETQAALEAAHAALDEKRVSILKSKEEVDQSAFVKGLAGAVDAIDAVKITVVKKKS